jgi:hypothetical protein
MGLEEIGAVRTRYGSTRFTMLGTYPGSTIVARVLVTCVSVYGLMNVYAQTTMLRIVADLIPLFDSPEGERVVLGGDLNVTTAILNGEHPPQLTANRLMDDTRLPLDWRGQRERLCS